MDNFDNLLKENGFGDDSQPDQPVSIPSAAPSTKLYDMLDSKKSESISNYIVSLINEYTRYYNNIYNKKQKSSLFDGIDSDVVSSTNRQLEEFYDAKYKFDEISKKNPNYSTIYKPGEIDIDSCEELYGIYDKNKLLVVSQSLFAVLIEMTNINKDSSNRFMIIPLKR